MITGNDPIHSNSVTTGLTKREYFAAMAMQANADNKETPAQIAKNAVELADALIHELNL